jgi:DNA-binding MarR family transcriptional regulator
MITSGAITNRVDRLTAKGLVRRTPDPDDRRSIRVELTPAGRDKVNDLLAAHMDNEERLLAALSPDDRSQLVGLLRTLSESLGDTTLA